MKLNYSFQPIFEHSIAATIIFIHSICQISFDHIKERIHFYNGAGWIYPLYASCLVNGVTHIVSTKCACLKRGREEIVEIELQELISARSREPSPAPSPEEIEKQRRMFKNKIQVAGMNKGCREAAKKTAATFIKNQVMNNQ